MTANSPHSAILDLEKLINRHNPFDRSPVVRSHDVWNRNFPDVPSINGHVSDAILQGIEQIRSGQRSVLGVTILSEKGLGKSHLISRLRRHFKTEQGVFFVYMHEPDYKDLNRVNALFLNALSQSLRQVGSDGVNSQWQELAALMINDTYHTDYSSEYIVARFPGLLARDERFPEKLTAKICQIKTDVQDANVLKAILWTLSPRHSTFAINWLSGKELSQFQAEEMGLPQAQQDNSERRAAEIATQVLDLIGDYQTIAICFDEVEPLGVNAIGLTTPQVIAALAKDLYSRLRRGVLIMGTYPTVWQSQVVAMPQAEAVMERIGEKVFDLKPLTPNNVVELVETWLREYYDHSGLTPPDSTYPFDRTELMGLGKERPIVRQVLKWCCQNWKVPGEDKSTSTNPVHSVEVAFREQMAALDSQMADLMENSKEIAEALKLSFIAIQGQQIESVLVNKVEDIQTKAVDKGYLDFRILGNDRGQPLNLGICVLQESGAKYVSATLKRLIDYKKFKFTRGCLVRSKAIKRGTNGDTYHQRLINQQGGEWVNLRAKDIQPLLAINNVYRVHQEYEVAPADILEFIRQHNIATDNYLIREILSDPSGQVPDSIIDEDVVLENSGGPSSPVPAEFDESELPSFEL